MLSLGFISFATPWALAGLAALPLVWLLLRLTPPTVRQIDFPAIRLLFGLDPTKRTPAHTPPWLMILRVAILALALLGLADPILNVNQTQSSGPVVIAIDNGWAAAASWEDRIASARAILEGAERRNQPAVLITTAPISIAAAQAPQVKPARDALMQISQIVPQPWPTDRAAAAQTLAALKVPAGAQVTWISDGIESPGTAAFSAALAKLGRVTVIEPGALATPLVQYAPERTFGGASSGTANSNAKASNTSSSINGIVLKLARPSGPGPAAIHTVRAIDAEGQVLARTGVTISAGEAVGTTTMSVPSELANRIIRFDVEGTATAATTILADDRWQRRPVGIASATAQGISVPLLEDAYYLREALQPFAEARSGTLNDLLDHPLAVLAMAGGGKILDAELARVSAWVDNGGILVRFAGPRLDGNVDPLLPVRLRAGGRTFGGTMSWNKPMALAPFPEASPFKGMIVPEDVTVSSQVLAEPSAELANKTWARLSDGTPLVTAERRGRGWIVLFHVTATPEWSTLPLSGLFMDMLHRLVDISQGVPADGSNDATGALAPYSILDGRGRLSSPGPTVQPISAENFAEAKATPATPPGLYGPAGGTHALNLSAHLPTPEALKSFPSGAARTTLSGISHERSFKPWLLTLALVLLLADLIISFALRRLVPQFLGFKDVSLTTGAALLLIVLAGAPHARAAEAAAPARGSVELDVATRSAVLDTRLGYISTGATDIDRVVASGMNALTQHLGERTAAELAEPVRIDLSSAALTSESLIPYPLLYWRVTSAQSVPAPKALTILNNYLHRGGVIVFDAPDQPGALGGGGSGVVTARLQSILAGLDIPQLTELPDDHVLNRSFYLLRNQPGRYADGKVLVERDVTANDGVSSVVIGSNDWAAAWATDATGPLYAVIGGTEEQRETAYRVGINMVIYALTGNYKSDQVHVPILMQRLSESPTKLIPGATP